MSREQSPRDELNISVISKEILEKDNSNLPTSLTIGVKQDDLHTIIDKKNDYQINKSKKDNLNINKEIKTFNKNKLNIRKAISNSGTGILTLKNINLNKQNTDLNEIKESEINKSNQNLLNVKSYEVNVNSKSTEF